MVEVAMDVPLMEHQSIQIIHGIKLKVLEEIQIYVGGTMGIYRNLQR